ncbi:DUF1803 domain-containing protein [Enterococcus sp. 669A]|uniref:DUF1803 domain-containing protein n=1 Tax=Candidatus Enterococcus moelleringii TaxID=2815325 RepID=A0ABS3LB11_9ENTE|nr:DUF1803 domain-containing protein [Enterococcus sp. 669A]MBO1306801.1 DUF1803 domain-containing protein [Enterococcus sp. 669A]
MKLLTTNKQLKKSLSDAQTVKLLEYLYQLEQPVILREIRAAFTEDQQLDKRLDLLIQTGVVERMDRRYRLILPIYQEFPDDLLTDQLEKLIGSADLLNFVEQFYPEELAGPVAVTFDLASRTVIENETYAIVTLNKKSFLQPSLPNYFYYQQQKRPEQFEDLEKLLGDVNPAFFFNQVELLLDSLLKGKKPKRTSIFLESLVMTKLAILEPTVQVDAPIVRIEDLSPDVVELWQQADEMTRYFTFHQLVQRLMGSEDTLSYIISKKD